MANLGGSMEKSNFEKSIKINYSGNVPIYLQLINQIRMQIKTGLLKPGEKMPPEEEICAMLGISRTTVRQAMNQLVEQGLLTRYRGKGTFVSSQKFSRSFSHLYNFSNDMNAIGAAPSSRVLKQEVIDVEGSFIQEQLELPHGQTKVFHLKRVRCANGEAILIEDTYLPYFLCPGIEIHNFEQLSLYDTLKDHYNLEPSNAIETLQALIIPAKEQKILGCRGNTVGYRIQRTARLNSNFVYEFTISITRGDICSYQFQLNNQPTAKTNSTIVLQQSHDKQ